MEKSKKLRYLAICAHPDDMEVAMGGCLWKLARAGHDVKIVSLTNGDAGHHQMRPPELAARRLAEAQKVKTLAGLAEYRILDIPDGRLEVSLANRDTVIRIIRELAPHVIFTLRPWDYHPDHRATGQLVQDASYLMGVPLICPEMPIPEKRPVILLTYDEFKQPCGFKADMIVSIDDAIEGKIAMLACHTSQFFEWLPYDRREMGEVPVTMKAKLAWLKCNFLPSNIRQADTFRSLLRRRHPQMADSIRHAECFELSEYGRRPEPGEWKEILPA